MPIVSATVVAARRTGRGNLVIFVIDLALRKFDGGFYQTGQSWIIKLRTQLW
jgi:hypothetical protein